MAVPYLSAIDSAKPTLSAKRTLRERERGGNESIHHFDISGGFGGSEVGEMST